MKVEEAIYSWFNIQEDLLFVVRFKSERDDKPHLLCVLDNSGWVDAMPFPMQITGTDEAIIAEWRFRTFYSYMVNQDLWPIHWPTPNNIIETYYQGKNV